VRQKTARRYAGGVTGSDEPRIHPAEAPRARFSVRFNHVYRSEGFGHLAVWFAGGRAGRVTILVGLDDPPTEFAGEVTAEMPSSCSAMIRPGEYWTVSYGRRDNGGFKGLFTPM
jgi:hypothetical protein